MRYRSLHADLVFVEESLHFLVEGSEAGEEALGTDCVYEELLHLLVLLQALDRLVDYRQRVAQLLAHAENHRLEIGLADGLDAVEHLLHSPLNALLKLRLVDLQESEGLKTGDFVSLLKVGVSRGLEVLLFGDPLLVVHFRLVDDVARIQLQLWSLERHHEHLALEVLHPAESY